MPVNIHKSNCFVLEMDKLQTLHKQWQEMVQSRCRSQLPSERHKAENCTLEKWRLLQTQWRTGKDKSAGSKLQSLAENWNMNIRCFQMPFKWISTLEPHVYCTYPNVLFEDKPFKLKSMPYSLPQVASKQFLVTTFIQFVWPNFFLSVAHPGMYVSYLLI